MNIIKAQDLLKGADDQTLARYLSNPTGEFPEYLVASEMKRREDMRKKFAAETQGQPNKSSLIQELITKAGLGAQPMPEPMPQAMPQPPMPPEAMGIGSVPPPQDMQMTPPPMLAAAAQAPQRMYDGGVVALKEGGMLGEMEEYLSGEGYAGGGAVDYYSRYAPPDNLMMTQDVPEVGNLESFFGRAQSLLGASGVDGYQEALKKQQEEVAKRKQNYLSDFLIKSGLGMATSKQLSPLAAAAEGVAQGFDAYRNAKTLDAQAERDLMESELKFKQAERAERAGVLGVSQKLYDSAVSQRNTAIDNNRQAAEARALAMYRADQAKNDAERLNVTRQELGIRGLEARRQGEVAAEQVALSKAKRSEIEARIPYIGTPKQVSAEKLALARMRVADSGLGQAKMSSLRKQYGIDKGKYDPAKELLVENAFNQWLDKQVPATEGIYTGSSDSV